MKEHQLKEKHSLSARPPFDNLFSKIESSTPSIFLLIFPNYIYKVYKNKAEEQRTFFDWSIKKKSYRD